MKAAAILPTDDEVVDFVRREGSCETDDVAERFGLTRKGAREILGRLKEEGRLHRTSVADPEDAIAEGYDREAYAGFHSEWKARA